MLLTAADAADQMPGLFSEFDLMRGYAKGIVKGTRVKDQLVFNDRDIEDSLPRLGNMSPGLGLAPQSTWFNGPEATIINEYKRSLVVGADNQRLQFHDVDKLARNVPDRVVKHEIGFSNEIRTEFLKPLIRSNFSDVSTNGGGFSARRGNNHKHWQASNLFESYAARELLNEAGNLSSNNYQFLYESPERYKDIIAQAVKYFRGRSFFFTEKFRAPGAEDRDINTPSGAATVNYFLRNSSVYKAETLNKLVNEIT